MGKKKEAMRSRTVQNTLNHQQRRRKSRPMIGPWTKRRNRVALRKTRKMTLRIGMNFIEKQPSLIRSERERRWIRWSANRERSPRRKNEEDVSFSIIRNIEIIVVFFIRKSNY